MPKIQYISEESKSISLEEKRIIKQIRDWKYFLNNTIGLFPFTFSISCAGMETKKLIIWINLFEEELLKMKKPTLSKGKYKLRNIKHRMISFYYGFKEMPIYWIGFLTLFGILYYNSMKLK